MRHAELRTGEEAPAQPRLGSGRPAPTDQLRPGDTSVLAGWKGVTHSGRQAAQGIPTQVPSCQKESKTPPKAATVGGLGEGLGQPQADRGGPTSCSHCSLKPGVLEAAEGRCPGPQCPPERGMGLAAHWGPRCCGRRRAHQLPAGPVDSCTRSARWLSRQAACPHPFCFPFPWHPLCPRRF